MLVRRQLARQINVNIENRRSSKLKEKANSRISSFRMDGGTQLPPWLFNFLDKFSGRLLNQAKSRCKINFWQIRLDPRKINWSLATLVPRQWTGGRSKGRQDRITPAGSDALQQKACTGKLWKTRKEHGFYGTVGVQRWSGGPHSSPHCARPLLCLYWDPPR